MIAFKGIAAVIVGQTICVTETNDGRYRAARFCYPNLFAQTLRGIAEDSEQRMAGHQIEGFIRNRQCISIPLPEFNLVG